jgi:hypothetical protein
MRIKIPGLIPILIIYAIMIFIFYLYSVSSHFNRNRDTRLNNAKFDRVHWATGDRRVRGKMANYLVDSIGVIGKDRNSIIFLLGKPDDSWISDTVSHTTAINYAVDLGETYLFFLNIYFNKKNIATRVDIRD